MENYEKAEQDYIAGMKYKDIAEKYGTTINTVKSWKKRYAWSREKGAHKTENLPYRNIVGCRKNEISERLRTIDMLLTTGRLKINRTCTKLRKALGGLKWDEKKPNIPEDKNIGNCNDWYDAFCYSWIDFVEYIDLDR